jgi:hypothetical protein
MVFSLIFGRIHAALGAFWSYNIWLTHGASISAQIASQNAASMGQKVIWAAKSTFWPSISPWSELKSPFKAKIRYNGIK